MPRSCPSRPGLAEEHPGRPHTSSPATITGRPSSSSVASRITQSRCATASTVPPYAMEFPSAMCAVPLRRFRLHRNAADGPRRVERHRDLGQVAHPVVGAAREHLLEPARLLALGRDELTTREHQGHGRGQRPLPHEQQVGVDHDGPLARDLDGRRPRLDVRRRHVVAVVARQAVQDPAGPPLDRTTQVGARRGRQAEGRRLAPGIADVLGVAADRIEVDRERPVVAERLQPHTRHRQVPHARLGRRAAGLARTDEQARQFDDGAGLAHGRGDRAGRLRTRKAEASGSGTRPAHRASPRCRRPSVRRRRRRSRRRSTA